MKMKELEAEQNRLIELVGVHYEKEEKLTPIAARIMSILLLSNNEGVTFDQFVTDLEASKSTVCTNLNILESTKRISYFTKPGDRKRYFSLASDYLIQRIDEMLSKWELEQGIQEQLIHYKEKRNKLQKNDVQKHLDLKIQKNTLFFLTEATKAIQKLKSSISQK